MELRVTFDIFSGRPNPVVNVEGREADELLERLRPARETTKSAASSPLPPLGYRGLMVEQVGKARDDKLPMQFRAAGDKLLAAGRTYQAQGAGSEELVLSSASARNALAPELIALLRQEIQSQGSAKSSLSSAGLGDSGSSLDGGAQKCPCAPLYEPDWWNDNGQKQLHNNCYNYACNYRTDTFAQPGRASGMRITDMSCAGVRPLAISDSLQDIPKSKDPYVIQCPKEGHLVALVIWPRWDFHWYRMGRDGQWSHKPGNWPVTNLDNSGKRIGDPRSADRGRYTDFCSFMIVMQGHIKIS
jgi:hypothetical protein